MSSFLDPYAKALGKAIDAQAKKDPEAEEHAEKAAMWSDLHRTATHSKKAGKGGRHHA